MVIRPRKRGSRRSYQEAGFGSPSFSASAVLKQTAAAHASMPTQAGGVSASRKFGRISARFGGACGLSSPSFLSRIIEVAARPQIASPRSPRSARSRAVITPVESRCQTISMSGLSASKAFFSSPTKSGSSVEYTRSCVRSAAAAKEPANRTARAANRQARRNQRILSLTLVAAGALLDRSSSPPAPCKVPDAR